MAGILSSTRAFSKPLETTGKGTENLQVVFESEPKLPFILFSC